MTDETTPARTRICTTCGRPADGPTTPIKSGTPQAGRVALLHTACYRQLLLDTLRGTRGEQ